MLRRPYFIIIALVIIWFILPIVSNFAANMTFAKSPAPWESVVGLYFPEGSRGSAIESPHFATLSQCKNWTSGMKSMHKGYTANSNGEWVCGWGIIRADKASGLPKMRDFIQGE